MMQLIKSEYSYSKVAIFLMSSPISSLYLAREYYCIDTKNRKIISYSFEKLICKIKRANLIKQETSVYKYALENNFSSL